MVLNPLIFLVLAAISLMVGITALNSSDNMMFLLPSLIFIMLFGLSLIRKVKI